MFFRIIAFTGVRDIFSSDEITLAWVSNIVTNSKLVWNTIDIDHPPSSKGNVVFYKGMILNQDDMKSINHLDSKKHNSFKE